MPSASVAIAREPLLAGQVEWRAALERVAADAGFVLPAWDPSAPEAPLVWAHRNQLPDRLINAAAGEVFGVPFHAEITNWPAHLRFTDKYPIAFARQHAILAIQDSARGAVLVLGDLRSFSQLEIARRWLGVPLELALAPKEAVLRAIDVAYQQKTGQTENLLDTLEGTSALEELAALADREDLLDTAGRAPVIKLVNLMLFDAVRAGASDVHVQPYLDRLVIRMRIDGVLFDVLTVPKNLQEEVISRIKIQGKMNIAEKRLPQDGRATVRVGDRLIDLRIASLPGSHGERVVIRLLDKSARLYSLTEVGMDVATLEQFSQLIRQEHGLILVTGPTGSGKSTTLYAALQQINTTDRNVVTLEDPIEYEIEGVSQTQINAKKGLTFATGLRNVLRQDPDIIMVGEIRDHETAVMAIQSALTGHLVFSTLHTNDAASAVTRLLDLGIEPYLVSSSVLAVLAQRLVRKICPECRSTRGATPAEREILGLGAEGPAEVSSGAGCAACRQTGYRGRLGIFELLNINEGVRDTIQARANAAEIRSVGLASGMRLLRVDGVRKVLAGSTTIDEVERVTSRTASA